MSNAKRLRTCANGHQFYKSSDCPTCPVCESMKTGAGFLARLGAPARRAFERAGIISIKSLSELTESEVLSMHGVGPSSLPKLREALAAEGLTFRQV